MNPISTPRIDKAWINTLDPIQFEGRIVVVTRPEQAERVAAHLRSESRLGFDTETRPAFRRGEKYPVAVLQLATEDTAYLFQLYRCGLTPGLVRLLSDATVEKVGVGIHDDIVKLQERAPFAPRGFVDLTELASERGIIQVGARGLVARYLHRRLVKSSQRSNWASPRLTDKQKRYAATDAWICLQLLPLILADTRSYADQSQRADDRDTATDNS